MILQSKIEGIDLDIVRKKARKSLDRRAIWVAMMYDASKKGERQQSETSEKLSERDLDESMEWLRPAVLYGTFFYEMGYYSGILSKSMADSSEVPDHTMEAILEAVFDKEEVANVEDKLREWVVEKDIDELLDEGAL